MSKGGGGGGKRERDQFVKERITPAAIQKLRLKQLHLEFFFLISFCVVF